MHTTTVAAVDRSQDGHVMAPVTPRVAKLLHALQAEVLRVPTPEPVAPGAIVLLPVEGERRVRWSDDGLRVEVCIGSHRYTSAFEWSTTRAQPEWARQFGPLEHAPGRWLVNETRWDEAGKPWTTRWATVVVDDGFGNLVEAPR